MRFSVVIPARNAAGDLPHLFAALLPQLHREDECILVDDASHDDTSEVARGQGIQVLTLTTRSGPAAARNHGVQAAKGDVILFLDADVVPHDDLLKLVRAHMREFSEYSAVIGSYDRNPHARTTVSRFRNLLHSYTHHNGNPEASTFWGGCGAIRRSEFLEICGFDAEKFPVPSIEDIEMGMRLRRAGKRIRLNPSLLVQHRKKWTLWSMLRTDLKQRAIPWTSLLLNAGEMPRDLNLKWSQRVSGIATTVALIALAMFSWFPWVAVGTAGVALLVVLILNRALYRFLAECGGWWFAIRCFPLHLAYFLCSVSGFAIANVQFRLGPRLNADVNR